MNEPFLRMLLIRHEKTRYVDPFPDLTDEGLERAQQLAEGPVRAWMTKHEVEPDRLRMLSSTASRAHGTAWTIAKEIGYTYPHRISFPDGLGPMVWRDEKKAVELLSVFRGKTYVDYETESVFKNAEVFETPSEARTRFYATLARELKHHLHFSWYRHAIVVSHYELLCNIVHDFFGIVASEHTALQHGEPIQLSFQRYPPYGNEILIFGEFRGRKTDVIIFNMDTHKVVNYTPAV